MECQLPHFTIRMLLLWINLVANWFSSKTHKHLCCVSLENYYWCRAIKNIHINNVHDTKHYKNVDIPTELHNIATPLKHSFTGSGKGTKTTCRIAKSLAYIAICLSYILLHSHGRFTLHLISFSISIVSYKFILFSLFVVRCVPAC